MAGFPCSLDSVNNPKMACLRGSLCGRSVAPSGYRIMGK
ncbi:hypothetical protein AFE_2878 [Acidithiobacillus ferrooxidans ATCC 23270]|uniref:Uncharacterized protein n=1 Tax=Acidithiobacillus ferrooxidans (strain ATCC 23270 / DSM 14882 / CIP 104768 / NCIMB 8455) TaxID=243159 RepID=B7J970_ACIF2|nr:hypothetical protein AFE_2878 [Acidithiobacillus ferrooxidans ATCC 23270]